jgi:hypothetical protein
MEDIIKTQAEKVTDLAKEIAEQYPDISYETHKEVISTVLNNYLGAEKIKDWYKKQAEKGKLTPEFIEGVTANHPYWYKLSHEED